MTLRLRSLCAHDTRLAAMLLVNRIQSLYRLITPYYPTIIGPIGKIGNASTACRCPFSSGYVAAQRLMDHRHDLYIHEYIEHLQLIMPEATPSTVEQIAGAAGFRGDPCTCPLHMT